MKSMDKKLDKQIVLDDGRFGIKARVAIMIVEQDGTEHLHFEEDNLIVAGGKQIALLSLYTSSLNDSLTYAKVGTGGSTNPPPGGDGSLLKTPIVTLTDLYSPLTRVGITKVSQDLSIPSITLIANLDNSQGNGSFINEAGFFSGNDQMFNIKVFPGIQKTWNFSVNFQWTIRIV